MLRRMFFLSTLCIMGIANLTSAALDPGSVVAVWLCDEGDGDDESA